MSARQIAQVQMSDAHAHKAFHFVTEGLEHPPNLAIDALAQDHAQMCSADGAQSCNGRAFSVERDAFEQLDLEGRIPRFVENDIVFFFNLVARMSQLLRKVAVVREDEEAFCLRVEAADVEEVGELRRQQIKNGIARMRIAPGRNETGRLVQDNRVRRLEMNEAALDLDVIGGGRLRAEVGADLAVDGDATGRDEFVAMTPGAETGRGEVAV